MAAQLRIISINLLATIVIKVSYERSYDIEHNTYLFFNFEGRASTTLKMFQFFLFVCVGCPSGLDPMKISNQMAEKGITIYMIGCEPTIGPYKIFFEGLAHVTGGQYVPLTHTLLLPMVSHHL